MVDDAEKRVKIHVDRVQHWVDMGARPSETVTSFLRKVDIKWNKDRKSRRAVQRAKKKAQGGS
jgi:small subunit ribosomal protein S16|tara:strand:+ start:203 stop:391 length:189 start_codon:yes stop_codon:yes gene_type:complete